MTSADPRPTALVRAQTAWRPLVVALVLALALPGPAAAAGPLPVSDPGAGTSPTPTQTEGAQVSAQSSTTFGIGDVFVAIGNGQVQWRLADGTLNATLDTGLGGYTTGMAFDKLGKLYVTAFTAGNVVRFDSAGTRLGAFGGGYNCDPESIVFDAAGDVYVGQADCSRDVLRFDGGGQSRATYDAPTGPRGTDWLDRSIDQCTLPYTSEGTRIKRFDTRVNIA